MWSTWRSTLSLVNKYPKIKKSKFSHLPTVRTEGADLKRAKKIKMYAASLLRISSSSAKPTVICLYGFPTICTASENLKSGRNSQSPKQQPDVTNVTQNNHHIYQTKLSLLVKIKGGVNERFWELNYSLLKVLFEVPENKFMPNIYLFLDNNMIKVMATIQFLRRRSCGGFCPQTGRSTSRCCVAWTAEAPKGIYDHCGHFCNFYFELCLETIFCTVELLFEIAEFISF